MRLKPLTLILSTTLITLACAHNPWWEAERSGWALFGNNVTVPRKAKPVPLDLLPTAAQWGEAIYVEGWIDSVDTEHGEWMMISDGTSPPLTVLPEGGFTLPRNARGRRAMAWGRPLVARSVTESDGDVAHSSTQVEFVAQSILIQGFYGLQAPPPARFNPPARTQTPTTLPAPIEESAVEDTTPSSPSNAETQSTPETSDEPAKTAPSEEPPPAPIVDLPD